MKRLARSRLDDGAPPYPPTGPLGGAAVDEGPMRSELVRQIVLLEQELASLGSAAGLLRLDPSSPRRGPAILSTADLEQTRDELVTGIRALHQHVQDLMGGVAHGR
ncbi:MAG: hypothetical protein JWO90_1376 [Solirubrobacterales bacterium]|jgi:hypothetical protein|nr:hypothetical protein [Solirubrobacterales bacterium]